MKLVSAVGTIVAIVLSSAANSAPCIKGGDTVTVTGIIHMRTLPPDPDLNRTKSWTYPVMTFDQPICVKDPDWGDVPDGKITSVVFGLGAKQKLAEGQHVSLRGTLSPPQTGSQPPEPLMLFVDK